MIRATLVASLVLLTGQAFAGSFLDLSAPQKGTFPSYLDLNDGKPSSWGEIRPQKEASADPVAVVPVAVPAPLPLSSMVMPAQSAMQARISSPPSNSRTLVVMSNTQRETVRPQPASRGFSVARRRR